MNYTYIVKCSDGTLYTGWTNDLEKRVSAHNSGKGAKYTKNRRPVALVYYEEFCTKEEAPGVRDKTDDPAEKAETDRSKRRERRGCRSVTLS